MNIPALAAEIAVRVPMMMQDCRTNNAHMIQDMIEKEMQPLMAECDFLRKQLDQCRAEHIKLRAEVTAANEKRRAAEERTNDGWQRGLEQLERLQRMRMNNAEHLHHLPPPGGRP